MMADSVALFLRDFRGGGAERVGQATIAADSERYGRSARIKVTSITLDKSVDDFADTTLMKMDIEGTELLALQSTGSTLEKPQAMMYESCGNKRCKDDLLGRMFTESGFSLREIDGNNWLALRGSA